MSHVSHLLSERQVQDQSRIFSVCLWLLSDFRSYWWDRRLPSCNTTHPRAVTSKMCIFGKCDAFSPVSVHAYIRAGMLFDAEILCYVNKSTHYWCAYWSVTVHPLNYLVILHKTASRVYCNRAKQLVLGFKETWRQYNIRNLVQYLRLTFKNSV